MTVVWGCTRAEVVGGWWVEAGEAGANNNDLYFILSSDWQLPTLITTSLTDGGWTDSLTHSLTHSLTTDKLWDGRRLSHCHSPIISWPLPSNKDFKHNLSSLPQWSLTLILGYKQRNPHLVPSIPRSEMMEFKVISSWPPQGCNIFFKRIKFSSKFGAKNVKCWSGNRYKGKWAKL